MFREEGFLFRIPAEKALKTDRGSPADGWLPSGTQPGGASSLFRIPLSFFVNSRGGKDRYANN